MMVLAYDYQGDCQQQHGEDTFWHPKWVWFKSTTVYRGVCWWWWWWWWRRWWRWWGGGGGCFEGSDNKFNTCWEGQCTLFDARRRPDPVAALHFAPLADFVAVWHWTRPRGNRMPPPRWRFPSKSQNMTTSHSGGPTMADATFRDKNSFIVSLYCCHADWRCQRQWWSGPNISLQQKEFTADDSDHLSSNLLECGTTWTTLRKMTFWLGRISAKPIGILQARIWDCRRRDRSYLGARRVNLKISQAFRLGLSHAPLTSTTFRRHGNLCRILFNDYQIPLANWCPSLILDYLGIF